MSAKSLFTCMRVAVIRKENMHTWTFSLDGDMLCNPGQYVMVWLPGVGEKPFSIQNDSPLAVSVCAVGPFSKALHQLSVGDQIWVRGPLGKGFMPQSLNHILVGGGYGAAPLSFLARQLCARGAEVSVCLGAKTRNDLLMADTFSRLGCYVHLSTEDGSAGEKCQVTSLLCDVIQDNKWTEIYACGPNAMLQAVAKIGRSQEIGVQLSFEGLIRCGIGLCGSCELDEKLCLALGMPPGFLVCHDGPVVRILWTRNRAGEPKCFCGPSR